MQMPKPGELNRRITIKDWQDVPNASAGIDQNFTGPLTTWAKHEPVGARLYQESMQLNEVVTDRFYIRYRESFAVDKNKVIEYDGTRFRIRRGSDLGGMRRFIVIETEALGPAQ